MNRPGIVRMVNCRKAESRADGDQKHHAYQQSLSNDPAILRERFVDPETGARRIYWTYAVKDLLIL